MIIDEAPAALVASYGRDDAGRAWLAEVAAAMVATAPAAVSAWGDHAERELVRTCAAAVDELLPDAGDRLLHWDLHDENVLTGAEQPLVRRRRR